MKNLLIIFVALLFSSVFFAKPAQAFHLGVGFGEAFNPVSFTVSTQKTKSFFTYFANSPDIGVMRVFDLRGPFYTAVGGHAGLGYNLPTAGPVVATGAKIDLLVLRLSFEYIFMVGHRGQMDGNAVIEIGAGW